ncbi:hypothetical protein OS038_32270, partial [Pseudomonas aeruginosa]|nr:hypothetical protein [Pseudomonas aeruginosa]
LEIRHRSVRPISAKHAQASRFLQQSPWNRAERMFRAGLDSLRSSPYLLLADA